METMEIIMAVVVALLGLSEGLALVPAIKSNSVFTLIVNILKGIKSIGDKK